jgi:hypothetical protein
MRKSSHYCQTDLENSNKSRFRGHEFRVTRVSSGVLNKSNDPGSHTKEHEPEITLCELRVTFGAGPLNSTKKRR